MWPRDCVVAVLLAMTLRELSLQAKRSNLAARLHFAAA
jgi:hypothetical protein